MHVASVSGVTVKIAMTNLARDNEKDAPTIGTTSPETGMQPAILAKRLSRTKETACSVVHHLLQTITLKSS
jgi:hypothetical protein